MENRISLDELDFLAYVDQLSDADPLRKAEIEEFLRHAPPEEVARIRAYATQTEALRRKYGFRIKEPVPARLYEILEREGSHSFRYAVRVAAAIALALVAGGSGWFIGQHDRFSESPSVQEFLDLSYGNYANGGPGAATGSMLAPASIGKSAAWLFENGDVSLTFSVPDLTQFGYSIVDERVIGDGNEQALRLTYATQDGQSFGLFLRPRRESEESGMRSIKKNGVSLVYWFDGSMVSAVVSQSTLDKTRDLANTIRYATKGAHEPTPSIHPAPPPSPQQEAGIAVDAPAARTDPLYPEQTLLPTNPVMPAILLP